jgi:radical SAM protein with 4Fe4S-binding SPASM domain
MCMVTFNWEEGDASEKIKNFKKRRTLSWVVIEVTEACNLNCIWCYANSGYGVKGKYMPLEKLENLLKMLADAGVRQVTYSGGEPTIYPHIREAVKLAKDMGFVVHMNTNGFLFTRDLARELRKLGLSQIQTNIDSIDPKKHDYIRGRKGSFERSLKALRNAKEAGITAVSQTVLTRMNEDEIFDIFALSRSLGAQRCRLWDMTPADGKAKNSMEIAPTDYVKTLEKLYEFTLETGLKSIESGEPLFPLGRDLSVPVLGGFCISYFGAYTTVSSEGNALYCAAYRKPLYNVFEDAGMGIEETHRQRLSEFISNNIKIPDSCLSCKFSKTCLGGCIVRREANKGIDGACTLNKVHLEKPILSSL